MPVLSLPVPERFGSRFTVRFLSHTEIENPHGLVLKTDSGRLGDPIAWVLDKYFNLSQKIDSRLATDPMMNQPK